MQPHTTAPFDFPPAISPSPTEVYLHLISGRHAAAEHAVGKWHPESPARQLIEQGLHQEALCRLERELFPYSRLPFSRPYVARSGRML